MILQYIKNIFNYFNPESSVDNTKQAIRKVKDEIKRIKATKNFKNNPSNMNALLGLESLMIDEFKLFTVVLDSIDDMIWAKKTDGTYILTNKSFREQFFYGLSDDEILGKNDIELAHIFKQMVGPENHTFGEVCGNSDVVVAKNKKSQKFLEFGLINGKIFKLMVNKTPVFKDGKLVAVCGVGKNVTEWHDAMESAIKADNSCFAGTKQLILDELNKYVFK